MNKGSVLVDLKPDKLLLDSSFEGYKLSLDSIPIYRKYLDSGVNVVQPSDEQYSFCHVKIFSLHNHLYVNPYKPDSVYLVDKNWFIFKANLSSNSTLNLAKVFEIPKSKNGQSGSYNISVAFTSPETAVISNGINCLNIATIKEIENCEVWENSGNLSEEAMCGVIYDGKVNATEGEKELNVLFLSVLENSEKENSKKNLFHTSLKWNVYTQSGNKNWKKKSQKELKVNGSVDYAAFEPKCKSIYVVSDTPPKWLNDSENPIQTDDQNQTKSGPPQKMYSWTQDSEELTLCLPLAEETTKNDIEVKVNDLNVEIKVKGKVILAGNFFQRVDKDLTSWTFERNQLEIQLTKQEEGLMWKDLLPGDERGEEILDQALVQSIHEKLSHLCSDKEESGTQPSFNSQQLEECDAVSCDTKSFVRICGKIHRTTHEVSLSCSQWLFKIFCEPFQAPAICCRHDVDACVWQFMEPKSDEKVWPYQHLGTFFAFGYVQASKTQKKFISSPPNLSYVAICEASHHIYIYRQPSPLSTELKNRNTGKKVKMISKQQLVNLETKDQILGVHATNTCLYVLLENSICALLVND